MLPSPRHMLRRAALLLALLLLWLILNGPGIPPWLATLGQIALWIGGALALYWLVREVIPALRGRRRP